MIIKQPKQFDKEAVSCKITYKDKFLLLHRTKDNVWGSIAGGIENGETKEQAIEREIKEELNLEIKPEFFLTTHHKYGKEIVKYHIFHYNFKKDPSDSIKLNFESKEFGFFSINETQKLDLFEDEDYCLKLYIKQKPL